MHQSHDRVTNDFSYHPPTDMTAELHDLTRTNFMTLAHWIIDNVPAGYAREQCVIRLRESMMWANGAIAVDSGDAGVVLQQPSQ